MSPRVKMSISIPRDLRQSMATILVEREVSWSEIATRAFGVEVDRLKVQEGRLLLGDLARARLGGQGIVTVPTHDDLYSDRSLSARARNAMEHGAVFTAMELASKTLNWLRAQKNVGAPQRINDAFLVTLIDKLMQERTATTDAPVSILLDALQDLQDLRVALHIDSSGQERVDWLLEELSREFSAR